MPDALLVIASAAIGFGVLLIACGALLLLIAVAIWLLS